MSRVKVCPLYNLMPALHQESLLDYVQKYSLQLQSDCPTACKTMLTLLNHLPNQVIGAQGTCSVLFSSDLQQKVTSLFFVLFFVYLFVFKYKLYLQRRSEVNQLQEGLDSRAAHIVNTFPIYSFSTEQLFAVPGNCLAKDCRILYQPVVSKFTSEEHASRVLAVPTGMTCVFRFPKPVHTKSKSFQQLCWLQVCFG